LNRENVTLYFHGRNESDYSLLDIRYVDNTTVDELLQHYHRLGYGIVKGGVQQRVIHLRFVYEEIVVVSTLFFPCFFAYSY
jgi:hypothetical protein